MKTHVHDESKKVSQETLLTLEDVCTDHGSSQ